MTRRRDPKGLREASCDNPRLVELPPEEEARQLVLEGLLPYEPSLEMVAEMMELEIEEEFDPDVDPGDA